MSESNVGVSTKRCWVCNKDLVKQGVGQNLHLVCPLHGSRGAAHMRDEVAGVEA